ncbi:alpha/beta hydrolase-fold protein [Pseudoalteromonas piratica]|uniref:Esterase n=1 Tax=Pseudoalteromonas piratica TaxID=1348114 RepID=A0A0A7EJL6_9GAMM|nr:alpha/beta hydrolase-fold protein [Pseudoalteromonas piratica]AIY66839.1 esterase [Pseudoalteromonas piratica]
MFIFKRVSALLLLLIFSISSFANESQYKVETINSKVLNEERTAVVQLPKSYQSNPNKVYPVLFRLDGKGNLPVESALLDSLHQQNAAPEVILVAIENTDRARDLTPTVNHDPRGPVGVGGGGDKFLDFIEKELIPHIEEKYRTHNFRIFSGASIGGLLVLHSFQSRPHLFQAHLAYSPAVWWGDESTSKDVKEFISNSKELDSFLYMNIGSEHAEMRAIYDDLEVFLKNNPRKGFTFVSDAFNTVPHGLTSKAGTFNAYHNLFLPLAMPSSLLTDGVSSIKEYYARVSFQRGEKTIGPEWAMRQLGYSLVDKKDFKTAEDVFKYNISLYPEMPSAYNGLAYAYEQNKQFQKALEQVNISLKLAKEGEDGYEYYINRKNNLESELSKLSK